VISEVTVTSVLIFYSRKNFSISKDKSFVGSIGLSILLMIIGIAGVKKYFLFTDSIVFQFIEIILVAVLIYGITLILTRNKLLIEAKNLIVRKILGRR